MRLKIRRKRWALLRWFYGWRYGRPMGGVGGGMLPQFGRGTFVSVHQRGPFLEMRDERGGGVVRLVPYQPNHGVMVEYWLDNRCKWRMHCDFDKFKEIGAWASEKAA